MLSSIDPSDPMSILNKYPQLFEIDHTFDYKSDNILNGIREEYVKNIKQSVPEILSKKLDRIKNMINHFTIYESYTFCHNVSNNIESSKNNLS